MVSSAEAAEAIEGVLLSDGHIASNHGSPYFKLSVSGSEHLDWLEEVRCALHLLGIQCSSPTVQERLGYFTKKPYNYKIKKAGY